MRRIDRLKPAGVRPISLHLLAFLLPVACAPLLAQEPGWRHYGGDAGGSRYSPAAQIHRDNVARLERAWEHRSGDTSADFAHKGFSFEVTPVLSGRRLFAITSSNLVYAIDAASGAELWRFDPGLDRNADFSEHAARGVSLWRGDAEQCPERVLFGTLDGRAWALDAATGEPCADFGDGGRVDLTTGVGDVRPGEYGITSPPAVIGDLAVFGSAIGDNGGTHLERGIVRALDVRTGAVRWAFDPIPLDPADPASASWENGSAARTGAANAWAPPSADPERGMVFVATGSASPDFWGGERLGDNVYANSVVALDAADGSVRWHRQLVHHDVWDYDVPMQPTLVDLPMADGPVPAVVIATKTGMLFAFHRETGAALHAVEERPVPASDLAGERLSPTQPFSTLPTISSQRALGPDDAFGLLWFDERWCREILSTWRSQGLFTPPTTTGTIMYPSWAGGANWGGVSVRPDGVAVVNANELPGLVKLLPIDEAAAARASGDYDGWEITAMRGTPWAMARRIFLSPLGMPCIEPPWGRISAIDLVTGELRWTRSLGTIADVAPGIVPDFEWGTPLMGGALQTGGGLVFVGAAAEHVVRALDADSGETLWEQRLPAAAMATPMSYVLDGIQYVVVAAGGHSHALDHRGDHLIAFRLPLPR